MSIGNVSRSELVEKLAVELKKVSDIKPPVWHSFVKTGCHTERPPTNPDWWFIRAASILTKLTDLGPIGVSKLRVKYGGKKNRGMAPERFKRSGGKILRLILQQLEKAGFAKQATKGLHKGRIITPKGLSFVEKVSYQMMKDNNVVIPQKVTPQAHSAEHKPAEHAPATEQAKTTETQQTLHPAEPAEAKIKKPRAPRKKKTEETAEVKNE